MAAMRNKANCLAEAVRALIRLQVAGSITADAIQDFKCESSSWPGHQFHRNAPAAPWLEFILTLIIVPDVVPTSPILETPAPVTRRKVPGGRNRDYVTRFASVAKNRHQFTMNGAAAFAITPRRYHNRTGDNVCPVRAAPTSRIKKRLGIVRLPIGEHQVGFGGNCVNDFRACDPVGAVARLKAAIPAE